jgi:hypothetical protein
MKTRLQPHVGPLVHERDYFARLEHTSRAVDASGGNVIRAGVANAAGLFPAIHARA